MQPVSVDRTSHRRQHRWVKCHAKTSELCGPFSLRPNASRSAGDSDEEPAGQTVATSHVAIAFSAE